MAYTNFTNCTEEQYKSIIYSQEDTNRIRIWFNNVELPDADEYCISFEGTNRILPDDGNKIFTLDNFVAKNYTLILRDLPEGTIISDQVKVSIGTLVNENNNTYEDVPIGIFNIQDTPTRENGKITIKLRDNRVKFDFNYNAQPLIEANGGTATKRQILQDICNKAGVTNIVFHFEGEDDEIGIYDNSITATTYVSYIFEQAGIMPYINREGQLDKIDFSDLKVWQIPLSIVEKYEKGTPFKIERVVYESGIIKYETSNDETLDTLYLDSANPYINNQEQIDNIYSMLVGFFTDSVKSGRILGNPAIDPFDMLLIYDDEINNNPITNTTGSNITLDNTPNAPMKIDLFAGTTTQTTTSGKNMFNKATITSGYRLDGSGVPSGAADNEFTSDYILVNPSTTYTRSIGDISAYTRTCFYDSSKTFISKDDSNQTFTTPSNAYFLRFSEYSSRLDTIQLEQGSSSTSYEPYTNGPTPNPKYPQPIETTTGENTIEVCGKNLLDMQNGTYVGAGITAIVNNGAITLNGTASGTSFINVPLKNIISINGSFTISANNNFIVGTISNWAGIRLGNVAYDTIGGQTAFSRTNTSETFNVENKDAYYLTIRTASGLSYNNNVIYPQIEKGSSSSSYEPFKGNSYEINLGKNLFDYSKITTSANFTNNNDGSFTRTANGTNMTINTNASSVPYDTLSLNAGVYSVSFDIKTTVTTTMSNFYLCTRQNGATANLGKTVNQEISANTLTHIEVNNYVVSKNAEKVGLVAYFGTSTGIVVSNIQIEKNINATSYSPYFTPIELCKIGTYQDRLFKASGKNLFDGLLESGSFNNSGLNTNTDTRIRSVNYINVEPNTRYTFSYVNNTSKTIKASISYYSKNDYTTARIDLVSWVTNNPIMFTTPNNCNYIRFVFAYSDDTTITSTNIVYNVQIEKGNAATTYEPYGTYWYKYNAVGKFKMSDFAVNNNISAVTTYQNNFNATNGIISLRLHKNQFANYNILNGTYIGNGFSDKFKGSTTGNWNNTNQLNKFSYVDGLIFGVHYTDLGMSEWAVWPSNLQTRINDNLGKVIFYLPLAIPTYERIINEKTIRELNKIKTAQTVEGTTNVLQQTFNIPFELNVESFNGSYILKTLANNTYKYTGINRNEFDTQISLEKRTENVSKNSEETYKKIAKTEIDAANATINIITGELGMVDGQSQVINGVISRQTATENTIDVITSFDENGNPIGVKTTKGFTFDKNGLNITSSDNTYKTKIDEQGTYYYDGEEILGQTTKEGSKFKNMDLYGEFHYGMDEITDTPLFVSMKFTDGSEECFGHFWNGS